MNAAARALEQGAITGENLFDQLFSRKGLGQLALIVAILISSFAVVCVKDMNRRLFSELQSSQTSYNQLTVKRGQLLLEQSTWGTPARVQQVAQTQLQMRLPSSAKIVMVRT